MRLHHIPDASTFPWFKGSCFVYMLCFSEKIINCTIFYQDTFKNLALCLHMILLHSYQIILSRLFVMTNIIQLPTSFMFCQLLGHGKLKKNDFFCKFNRLAGGLNRHLTPFKVRFLDRYCRMCCDTIEVKC
jgi:hypothetical protein